MIDAATQDRIRVLLREFVESWIARRRAEIDVIAETGQSPSGDLAPFHDALVPGVRGLGERGFSTSLGNLHERIGLAMAQNVHAAAVRAFDLTGNLPVLAREFITQRIAELASRAARPDHTFERDQLLASFGSEVVETKRSDLFVTTHAGEEHYFEFKSPKANKGQCEEMKRTLLTIFAIRKRSEVFVWWGIPYNPYGSPSLFSHPYPLSYFDFEHDVKLGADLWSFLGADENTYDLLMELYREVGAEFTDALDDLREALAGRGV